MERLPNREQLARDDVSPSECLHFHFQGCLVNAPNPASGRKEAQWQSEGENNLVFGRPQKADTRRTNRQSWISLRQQAGENIQNVFSNHCFDLFSDLDISINYLKDLEKFIF